MAHGGDFPFAPRGLYYDREKDRPSVSHRSKHIDDDGEERMLKLVDEYNRKGKDAWDKFHPCSHFASEAWEKATGETLEDRNWMGISSPSRLRKSINKANER